jgi:hypothetical protein
MQNLGDMRAGSVNWVSEGVTPPVQNQVILKNIIYIISIKKFSFNLLNL